VLHGQWTDVVIVERLIHENLTLLHSPAASTHVAEEPRHG
jgi:hypothetical protein